MASPQFQIPEGKWGTVVQRGLYAGGALIVLALILWLFGLPGWVTMPMFAVGAGVAVSMYLVVTTYLDPPDA